MTESQEYEQLVEQAFAKANLNQNAIQRLVSRGDEFKQYLTDGLFLFSAEPKQDTPLLESIMGEINETTEDFFDINTITRPASYAQARSILGEDFITPEEIILTDKDVFYTGVQVDALKDTMPTVRTLHWCKNNDYALMPAPPDPVTLSSIRGLRYVGTYPPLKKGCLLYTSPSPRD